MIPVNDPRFEGREKEYLIQCIDQGWISSDGPFVRQFENMFARFIGVKHGVAVCNGTTAIELAFASLDIKPGDEVLLPAHTIISCAMGILRRGATPVLVDVTPDTWTLSVPEVMSRITSKTKAIMPVHMFGHSCDMDPIRDLAGKHGVRIVEDSAEAHGATYKGHFCGSLGDLSVFSFYANKIITTGEGGMLLTDDDGLAERARSYRNLCFLPRQRFFHEELGYNFRMTNLQAAVGVAQMERIDELVERKKQIGARYRNKLKNIPGLILQDEKEWATHVYWVFGLVLDDSVPFDAFQLAKNLEQKGVQTRPFFWPLHQQPVLNKMGLFLDTYAPVSEKLARRGLYLPSGMGLTNEQMDFVCSVVEEIMKKG